MDKVMIVTGGGRGIGAAIAELAASRGYAVCINYNASAERAETLAAKIAAAGGRAIAARADMANEADIVALFELTDRQLGPVDALVNNAGIDYETAYADADGERMERVVRVNVLGPMLCAREAMKRMATSRGGRGGVIVNIGSLSARMGGTPGDVVYTATKGAMDSFTLGLGLEAAKDGIRVCCVRPGATRTEIFDNNEYGMEHILEFVQARVPMARIGEPIEIANMVLWLCSDEASYATGAIFDIAGGLL